MHSDDHNTIATNPDTFIMDMLTNILLTTVTLKSQSYRLRPKLTSSLRRSEARRRTMYQTSVRDMAEAESFFVLRMDRPRLQWILASGKKQQIPHGLKPVRDDKK
jgi:hypothetical protein